MLLELTSGAGSSLGSTFEELAAIIEAVPEPHRSKLGICFDSCHAHVGAYDLVDDFDGVWRAFDDVLGLDRISLLRLNDVKTPRASRRDRHDHIGAGHLGLEPFRRLVTEDRFRAVPKLLETPKEKDPVAMDRMNLDTLRRLRREGRGEPVDGTGDDLVYS